MGQSQCSVCECEKPHVKKKKNNSDAPPHVKKKKNIPDVHTAIENKYPEALPSRIVGNPAERDEVGAISDVKVPEDQVVTNPRQEMSWPQATVVASSFDAPDEPVVNTPRTVELQEQKDCIQAAEARAQDPNSSKRDQGVLLDLTVNDGSSQRRVTATGGTSYTTLGVTFNPEDPTLISSIPVVSSAHELGLQIGMRIVSVAGVDVTHMQKDEARREILNLLGNFNAEIIRLT